MRNAFILLLLHFISYNSFGQCCSAGNPVGGDGSNDGLVKNELRIFASYKYSNSKDYFHNENKTEIPYIEKSYFDYSNLSLTYGLSNRLSLHSELGYFIDKTQELKMNNEKDVINSRGLGDLLFNIRYLAIKTVKPISQLVFSAGMRFPIGAFNEEIDGVTIPISLQPSSGALKYNASAFYTRKLTNCKFGLTSFALFELSQTINHGFLIYQYGNYFQYSIAGTYALTKNVIILVNSKLEWRGRDKRESKNKVESSGSRVIYVNPQITLNLNNKWGVIIMGDIPVYKFVNGYQLTNKFSFQIGLRKNISLFKTLE